MGRLDRIGGPPPGYRALKRNQEPADRFPLYDGTGRSGRRASPKLMVASLGADLGSGLVTAPGPSHRRSGTAP